MITFYSPFLCQKTKKGRRAFPGLDTWSKKKPGLFPSTLGSWLIFCASSVYLSQSTFTSGRRPKVKAAPKVKVNV